MLKMIVQLGIALMTWNMWNFYITQYLESTSEFANVDHVIITD